MRRSLTVVAGALAALLIGVGVWVAFAVSGFYNVAASEPHTRVVEWMLETMTERSVAARADALPAPLPTGQAELLHGLEHYRAMCVVCHGAPGVDRNELAEGLRPRPPRLVRAAAGWTDEELFWIVKHGIKATAMPAFGGNHSDAELLQIVAIVRRLPDMSEQEYASLLAALDSSDVHRHDEPPGTPATDETAAPHEHAPGTAPHGH